MYYERIDRRFNNVSSFFFYIISGYIIVILYLFLCRYEFFPMHFCFNAMNSSTFSLWHYQITIILFQDTATFQKHKNACSRFMKYYQVLLLPYSALVLLYRYISDPSIFAEIDHRFDYEITCQSFCYNTVWNIFSSSVIAGLFILPSLLIYFIINKWYTKSRSKKIKLQHCQTKKCITQRRYEKRR